MNCSDATTGSQSLGVDALPTERDNIDHSKYASGSRIIAVVSLSPHAMHAPSWLNARHSIPKFESRCCRLALALLRPLRLALDSVWSIVAIRPIMSPGGSL